MPTKSKNKRQKKTAKCLTKREKWEMQNSICPPFIGQKKCKNLKKCTYGGNRNSNGGRSSPTCHLTSSEMKKLNKSQEKCDSSKTRRKKKKTKKNSKTINFLGFKF